ncbi:MAG: CDP-diacylglycerol--serine O-phosphatidyltransferase [Nitrospira sp.]|nr:CDP-diacylglycerol--serine O-phosphatidyltransferase [Nitrospira sp.]
MRTIRQKGQKKTDEHPRRGIYILPSLFTTAGLFAGFFAIVQAMNGNFEYAPLAVFIAMIMDTLDGRVARWTRTESDFGAEFDSLADVVSFGLAPALVMYEWALSGLGKLGWLAAFIYAACGALRLARFNTQLASQDKRYFQGLPIPAAAAVVMAFVWVLYSYGVPGKEISILALLVTVLAGVLMVSNIRYRSFKDLNLKGRVPFVTVLAVPLLFVLVFLDPPQVLFMFFLAYAASGPAAAAWKGLRRTPERQPEHSKKL